MIMNKDDKPADGAALPTLPRTEYELPDLSVGDTRRPDPLDEFSWPDLRSIICDESEPRSAL